MGLFVTTAMRKINISGPSYDALPEGTTGNTTSGIASAFKENDQENLAAAKYCALGRLL